MKKQRVYLSTIDPEAGSIARAQGLGVEIAEYCTASNMDEHFEEHHQKVLAEVEGVPRRILHGPFNELFPCAIDPKARRSSATARPVAWRQTMGQTRWLSMPGLCPMSTIPAGIRSNPSSSGESS